MPTMRRTVKRLLLSGSVREALDVVPAPDALARWWVLEQRVLAIYVVLNDEVVRIRGGGPVAVERLSHLTHIHSVAPVSGHRNTAGPRCAVASWLLTQTRSHCLEEFAHKPAFRGYHVGSSSRTARAACKSAVTKPSVN
jgi:hypothetical protein